MRLPTRRIERNTTLTVRRCLPIPGEIFVRVGQTVTPSDIVARAALPSHYTVVNIARALRQSHPDMAQVMQFRVGMDVSAGDVLAKAQGRFLAGRRMCKSPVDGIIAAIVGYRVLIETEARWTELSALVHGTVETVQHTLGVTLSATGDAIDGACGQGEDAFGELVVISEAARLEENDTKLQGKIVVMRDAITPKIVHDAEAAGVRGIIAGSFDLAVLDMSPEPALALVATESIGTEKMAEPFFDMLAANAGNDVALEVSGGLGRPRMVISGKESVVLPRQFSTGTLGQLSAHARVRVPQNPHLGWGKLQTDADGQFTVEFATGIRTIPWQNLELLP